MLTSWLHDWFHRPPQRRRPARWRRYLPQLERLEDRTVPSAIRDLPGFRANVLARNDDLSTARVPIGFNINFFGLQEQTLFVNNNGNVTFDAPLFQFTPDDLTTPGHPPIIAPFFADVDTRNPGSGVVTYGNDVVDGQLAFGVDYFSVGYFDQRVDLLNTFQLILIDRCGGGGDGSFDIEFNYQQIQWETGEASLGINGLGGFSAHVGFTNGSGVPGTFFELPGSGVNGAFLDGGPNSLINASINSTLPGRTRFFGRGGSVLTSEPLPPTPVLQTVYATGADAGGGPEVKVYDAFSNKLKFDFLAYDPHFTGGVRVATGDVNGDGYPDIITAPGPGGGPNVRVFNGRDLSLIANFMAYDPRFRGGVNVAAGDINVSGHAFIITGPDAGGGPNVRVFDAAGTIVSNFMAFNPRFTGGIHVAAGDVNDDRTSDIVVGAGAGGGPNVAVFDGASSRLLTSFFAYDPRFTGGVFVGTGKLDLAEDPECPKYEIITGPGNGGGADVRVFDGVTGSLLRIIAATPQGFINLSDGQSAISGARVSGIDYNLARPDDILVAYGPGVPAELNVYNFSTGRRTNSFFAYNPLFSGGIFVASGHY